MGSCVVFVIALFSSDCGILTDAVARPGKVRMTAISSSWTVNPSATLQLSVSSPTSVHDTAPLTQVSYSATGGRFTGEGDSPVKLWSASSFKQLITLPGEFGVMSVAFSPDGRTLATLDESGSVRLWHAATDEEVRAKSH